MYGGTYLFLSVEPVKSRRGWAADDGTIGPGGNIEHFRVRLKGLAADLRG